MPDNIDAATLARASVITGLRELADFLDANPAVPVSQFTECDLLAFTCRDDTDSASRAEVDQIAAMLGVQVRDDTGETGGHYAAVRSFGPVRYKMIYIPARCRAAHAALMSYSGCVTPDTVLKAA